MKKVNTKMTEINTKENLLKGSLKIWMKKNE